MALDLNTSPYYDDFSGAKNFHRVLFKPGVAVQARELTQLQTLLQDQMGKGFGFVLQEGAIVTGCAETVAPREWIKIFDTDNSSVAVDNSTLVNYVGDTITGGTTGLTALITNTATGTQAATPALKKLYFNYTNGSSTHTKFQTSEVLTITSTDAGRNGDTFVAFTSTSSTDTREHYIGTTNEYILDSGIIYARGNFIRTDKIKVLQNRYSKLSYANIGFVISETAVNSATDTTLLDPAQGSFNYNAPGADRLKFSVTLSSIIRGATPPENFFTYLIIEHGGITRSKVKDNPLSGVGQVLANRTYDESGNYTVQGMQVDVREHLQNATNTNGGLYTAAQDGLNNGLILGISPGKSYVGGYKRTLDQTKRIAINKANDFVNREAMAVSTSFGNYVNITYVSGIWDIDGGGSIDLYNAVQNGDASAAGLKVGTAKARHVVYSSGTPGTTAAAYKLYIYDIQMISGNFQSVKGVRYENDIQDGVANNTLESSIAVLKEGQQNKLMFAMPNNNIKTLASDTGNTYDYTFQYTKEFDVTLGAGNGSVTLSTTGDETFPYDVSGSALLSTIKNANIIVVAKKGYTQNSASISAGQYINMSAATSSVTLASAQTMTIDLGGAVTITGSETRDVRVYVNVLKSDSAPVAKTLVKNRIIKIDTSTNVNGVSGEYDLGLSDGHELVSVTAGTNSDYTTGQTNVTDQFRFTKGQEDNFVGHSKIYKKGTSTLNLTTNKYLVVTIHHFTQSITSATFSCVDSYPVDDTATPEPNQIRTENIPVYRSNIHGDFDLRNTIDFRPRILDTATSTTTLGSASVNPSTNQAVDRPGNGLTNPVPVSSFTTDYNYYRGKNLRVILDDSGDFRILEGAYADKPATPVEPEKCMTLATVQLKPYPCLGQVSAKLAGRADYGAVVGQLSNKRFTMKDIGSLESRIKNLEYYASLNLLEGFAKDQTIVNASGIDRFKNGILVDGFTGHNVGAVLDPDYHIAIDTKQKHARPFFKTETIPTTVHTDIGNNAAQSSLALTGKSLTLPYNVQPFRAQMQASQTINLAEELIFHYNGVMTLTPDTDNWVATDVQPAVTKNFDGNYDAWENMADAWGTQWGSWEDTGVTQSSSNTESLGTVINSNGGGSGTQHDSLQTTTTTQVSQVRQGVSLNINASTETQNLGEKVVDVSFAPFMRSMSIDFRSLRLKPNTIVYPYFDGELVTAHCKQGNAAFGAVMTTDADGRINGEFRIPEGQFKTGAKIFKITDSASNNDKDANTISTAIYETSGLRQKTQDTIIALKTANVASTFQTDDRTRTDVSVENSIGVGVPLPPPPAPIIIQETITIINEIEVPSTPIIIENIVEVIKTVEVPVITVVEVEIEVPVIVEIFVPFIPDPVIPPIIIGLPEPIAIDPVVNMFGLDNFDFDFIGEMNFGMFNGGGDPLAQTFIVQGVPGGIFLSDIKIFFKTKPSSGNNGVTLELREVINGVPGPKVLPNGLVYKTRENVQTSSTIDSVTTFTPSIFAFSDPVYLKNDTEYCFVPKPENDDTGYELWISELGENQFGTTNRITKQPAAGMMFTSANDRTWNAHQSKDLMFEIRRCWFKKGVKYSGTLTNQGLDWMNFTFPASGGPSTESFVGGEFINGHTLAITAGGTGYSSAPTVSVTRGSGDTSGTGLTITSTVSGGVVTALTVTNPGHSYSRNPVITIASTGSSLATATDTLAQGKILNWNSLDKQSTSLLHQGKFTTGMLIGSSNGYATIASFTDKKVNDLLPSFSILNPGVGCSIAAKAALTNTGAGSANTSVFQEIDLNQTTTLTTEKTIYSNSNEQTTYSDTRTGRINVTMLSTSSNLSPLIDISQSDMLGICNEVNNDATNETGRTGGNALSKYITRRVILEEGQDAEDIQVYLDAEIPASSSLRVYGKFLNAADSGNFQEDLDWVQLEENKKPSETTENFAEYSYKIPAKSGGVGTNASGILEYDVDVVQSIAVSGSMSGYTSSPNVTITGGGGFGATATATVSGGVVTAFVITNPGRKYTSAPTIALQGGGGTGAVGTATVATITYTGYKTFAVKIVPLSSTTVNVPKFKDLRAIALQV